MSPKVDCASLRTRAYIEQETDDRHSPKECESRVCQSNSVKGLTSEDLDRSTHLISFRRIDDLNRSFHQVQTESSEGTSVEI